MANFRKLSNRQTPPRAQPQSRSVFHTDLNEKDTSLPNQDMLESDLISGTTQEKPKSTKLLHESTPATCMDSMALYMENMQQLSGAGTQVSSKFSDMLKGTSYGEIAGQFHAMWKELDASVNNQCARTRDEIKKDYTQQWKIKSTQPTQDSSEDTQFAAKSLMKLMQMQYQFFASTAQCLNQFSQSHKTLSTNSETTDKNSCITKTAVSEQNKGDMQQNTGSTENVLDSAKGEEEQGNQDIGSDSQGIKKQLSSFFSKKRGNKPSSTSPVSQFYINTPIEAGSSEDSHPPGAQISANTVPKSAERSGGGVVTEPSTTSPNTELLSNALTGVQLQDTRNRIEQSVAGKNQKGGQIVSQEDLDNVIDFLSGGQRQAMQSIPENLPTSQPLPKPHNQPLMKAVGSHLTGHHAYPSAPEQQDLVNYSNMHQQRCSDSILREPAKPEAKRNTWPFKMPHHTGSIGGDPSRFSMGQNYDPMCSTDPEYSQYIASIHPGRGTTVNRSHVAPQPQSWSLADASLQKAWQYHHNYHLEGMDANPRWSAVGDSSSCSDESSNGEIPWMMGLDLMSAMTERRRHSSGEDALKPALPVANPKSVDDLMSVESKSTKTWPPKQPYGHGQELQHTDSNQGLDYLQTTNLSHPPLSHQWSDPLRQQPLSTWGLGGISLSQHNLQNLGSLPATGSTEFLRS